ncbi:hypothetical protein O3P69_008832 [Scylla paramamosain]|uniref:Uncharacterized protein n=1 Tax=Scylla paramamosain TaxID=85552 RepID=A0AAW0TNT6_SCYPA
MGLQSHSPLKKNFDKVVNWVVEAGLVQYWFEETLMFAKKIRRETPIDHEDYSETQQTQQDGASDSGQTMPLSVEHLQSVFIVFLVGNLMAIVVFIIEIFYGKVHELG